MTALKNYSSEQNKTRTVPTPVGTRTPGRTDEVRNSDGGFVFKVSDKDRLERFLILGTEKGTYYSGEKALTTANATFVKGFIKTNERLVVDTIVDISDNGRASKNSPALFALALVLSEGRDKAYARAAVPKVARTGTHLFELAQYINDFGGWGRAKRKAVAEWYEEKDPAQLAYQAVKYRQRNGWTHRDLFRLSHPTGVNPAVGNFILGKKNEVRDNTPTSDLTILTGFEFAQRAKTEKELLEVLDNFKTLPWEALPTQFLKSPEVWKHLFSNGAIGQTALLRNVTRFAKIGAFDDLKFVGDVAKALADKERIEKGRVHPVAYANALGIYRDGRNTSHDNWNQFAARQKDWTSNAKILGALEAGFYNSFGTVVPSNKRTMVSIDVSGSMTWWGPAGLVGLDCRQAAALMAMVLVRTEPYVEVNAFSDKLVDARISDTDSLETVQRKIDNLHAGATNISLPITSALKARKEIDTFTIWTDNEVNRGVKPAQALQQYRKALGIDARLAVVGMTATDFTVADPTDNGMMDFVGFDSNAPRALADFSAGRL